jgi:protein TonB
MLEDSLIESTHARGGWTITLSVAMHAVMVGVALLIPLIHTSALPIPELSARILAPAPAITEMEIVPPLTEELLTAVVPQVSPNDLIAPTLIPREIMTVHDVPPVVSMLSTAPNSGIVSSILEGALRNETAVEPPAPPPPLPEPAPVSLDPVRISAGVQQANLIQQVLPVYPPLARLARIEGSVVLEAVISKDGAVDNLRVLSGHQMLIQAAIDAVSRWRYRPTLLSNEPVEVITTVTVMFRLGQ